MPLEAGISVALGGLALWLLAHGLDYIEYFEKHKTVKKAFGWALIIDFLMVVGTITLYG